MEMISYWHGPAGDKPIEFFNGEGIVLIYGRYDHRNGNGIGRPSLGVYWKPDYPQSRGKLSPCVLSPTVANALLDGLMLFAEKTYDKALASKLIRVRQFLEID